MKKIFLGLVQCLGSAFGYKPNATTKPDAVAVAIAKNAKKLGFQKKKPWWKAVNCGNPEEDVNFLGECDLRVSLLAHRVTAS